MVALGRPLRREVVTADRLEVVWTAVGKPPDGYTLALNGRVVARHLTGTETTVAPSDCPDGPIHLILTAEGTKCRCLPSYTEDALPLEEPVPAFAEVDFPLKRGGERYRGSEELTFPCRIHSRNEPQRHGGHRGIF